MIEVSVVDHPDTAIRLSHMVTVLRLLDRPRDFNELWWTSTLLADQIREALIVLLGAGLVIVVRGSWGKQQKYARAGWNNG